MTDEHATISYKPDDGCDKIRIESRMALPSRSPTDPTTGLVALDIANTPWRLKIEIEGQRELIDAVQVAAASTINRYKALQPGEGFTIDLGDGSAYLVRKPEEFTVEVK